uniref:Glutamine amidotransferase domain-containing protein n=1 Tax=Glossina palpalis gambiensis TaxID=67801 RepID=A0A1B0BLG1_9MUSC
MFSETLAPLFQTFKQRKDTFSLGICNGCQLMTLIGWVGSFDESTVKQIVDVADVVLLQNKSERFR